MIRLPLFPFLFCCLPACCIAACPVPVLTTACLPTFRTLLLPPGTPFTTAQVTQHQNYWRWTFCSGCCVAACLYAFIAVTHTVPLVLGAATTCRSFYSFIVYCHRFAFAVRACRPITLLFWLPCPADPYHHLTVLPCGSAAARR